VQQPVPQPPVAPEEVDIDLLDEDTNEYDLVCTHCGTEFSGADGFDAGGSRRCDDTDPEHRYHQAEEN
jgi:hypothetical protein